MTLDRPERGHSRINVFGSADAPRKNGSDRMKRKTMAIFAVAAFVILSAVLIQAVDTDAREGDNETSAKYIIGEKDKGVQIRTGQDATISFNRSAFSDSATVSFDIKGTGDYQAITVGGSAVSTGRGIEVTITSTADDIAEGVYKVKFVPEQGATVTDGTSFIKMTVTESKDQLTLSQTFYYAANITEDKDAKFNIQATDGSDYKYIGKDDTGQTPSPGTRTFEYGKDIKMTVYMDETNGTGWFPGSGYVFYGEGFPDGVSLNIDGVIGGRLSSEYAGDTGGTMTIHAVKDGVHRSLSIDWIVGKKLADFKLTVNDEEKNSVMVKVNESIDSIKIEENGAGTIDKGQDQKYKITVTTEPVVPEDISTGEVRSEWKLPGYSGTGTYTVTITADMTLDGRQMKVEKTLTIYVIGGVYDGDLKPVVKTA